ncbi:MAG: helix-turn-helix domain-containing protein [Candidatus Magasanikbacteria bacterium]|jgi:excisionase family DNA binding protein|nr:helix-turn-helix domain-containing protein [Candidatus Magasanikbacteria bacterium]MBT5262803.1 helix-turn-helix domain-containing protein [Candidatus Magasanikbacteria bacterium]MBT5820342.1 helix-turn-helix domain-containing protein [Candidatus Magasanikbacteria bacterium]MBT6294165.1 helix-turn-helix domain-containing protein [Candidatus Magasanikbacteria bacterium]
MNPPTTVPEQTIIRVSVSEAARLFGISQQTVRRALKNNAISFIVIGNRYKIDFASLVTWSQSKITVKNKMNGNGIGQFVAKWRIPSTS